MSIEDLTPLQLDELFIAVTGTPKRDTEMLSWDNLYFDSKFKCIRCNTCGCPAQICTCTKIEQIQENKS